MGFHFLFLNFSCVSLKPLRYIPFYKENFPTFLLVAISLEAFPSHYNHVSANVAAKAVVHTLRKYEREELHLT